MNENITLIMIAAYSAYGFFSFMQKRHMSRFQGASQVFNTILTLFVTVTTITSVGLLIYYGFTTVWWAPVVVFFAGMFVSCVLAAVTVMIPDWILSLSGFVVVPLALIFMWLEIQKLSGTLVVQ